MSRTARKKEPYAIYHITSRSINEFDLFPENYDKERFLDFLQQGAEKNHCKIYGFCLMTNHYHLIIDTNGYNISSFIGVLNQRYVRHINDNYGRRGPLMDGRFHSKIINSDQYLMTASAYIHNNPKDIRGYNGREFEYPYSSMAIYLEKRKDNRNLVDTDFILGILNNESKNIAIKLYAEMVIEKQDIVTNNDLKQYLEEFKSEIYEYRSNRNVILRDERPEELINIIAKRFGIENISKMMHKWKRDTMSFRCVVAYSLNVFCGMNIRDVCKYMNNITASCCAKLRDRGFSILQNDIELKPAIFNRI